MWNKKSYPMKASHEESDFGPSDNFNFSKSPATGLHYGHIGSRSDGCHGNGQVSNQQIGDSEHEEINNPLLYCKFIVRYPWHAFALTLLGHLLMLGVSLVLVFMKFDVFPGEFRQIPFWLNGHHALSEFWGWSLRNTDQTQVFPRFSNDAPNWERGVNSDPLSIIYFTREHKANLLTRDILTQIDNMENWLMGFDDYKKICQLKKKDGPCVIPTSIIRYFDGSKADISPIFNDTKFENVTRVVYEAYHNPRTKMAFNNLLGNKTEITKDKAYADYLRSAFPVGFPIHGKSWQSYVGETAFENIAPAMEKRQQVLAPKLHVSPISWSMFVSGAAVYGVKDILLVLGSVIFIFIFMWFQTGSFWITFFAVFSIITSFLGTNLIYRYIFEFRYFSYFHLISMFIILGIGADDIFVFVNTWRASAFDDYSSLEHRMSDVYKRAAVTMFATSLTTMVAFFVTSISPLMVAKSFGLFSGLLVIINYVSVVVFFPCVIVLYHKYFEHSDICAPFVEAIRAKCCKRESMASEECEERKAKPSFMMRFFSGPYYNFISHRIIRWVILGVFVVLIGLFSWFTHNLTPDAEQILIFKDSTLLGRGWKLSFSAFKPEEDTLLTTRIVWGVRPRNLTMCHFSDYNCRGTAAWDDAFDMNQPEVQIAMRDMCRKLKYNLTESQINQLNIRRNARNETYVDCFMDDMGEFLVAEAARLNNLSILLNSTIRLDLSFPLTERKVRPFMELFSHPTCKCPLCLYDLRKLKPTFYRYFEVMLGYWLTNRYTLDATPDFLKYKDMLGEGPDGSNTRIIECLTNSSGCSIAGKLNLTNVPKIALPHYGTRLRYATIPVNLSVNVFGLGYVQGLPIYRAWQDFLNQEIPKIPFPLRNVMQANDGQWHWLFVQESVVNSALVGVGLGISLALPILILATKNYIVGTISTLIITVTCVCIVGVIPLCGWKLGLLVSINLCLVVGLSVDYIVHMAEGYHLSLYSSRADKIKDTLEKMGISVISGAITTLGASFFMFFGNTQFFLQFATFMFSTIGFATLFSIGFFPVIMLHIGPEGNTGSLPVLCRKVISFFKGRQKTDVKCERCRGKGFVGCEASGECTERRRRLSVDNFENPCFESPSSVIAVAEGNTVTTFIHGTNNAVGVSAAMSEVLLQNTSLPVVSSTQLENSREKIPNTES